MKVAATLRRSLAAALRWSAASVDRYASRLTSYIRRGARAVDEPTRLACGWGAEGCQREATHVVVIEYRPDAVPMCTHCASVFDPDLGARSGYVGAFRGRVAINATGGSA